MPELLIGLIAYVLFDDAGVSSWIVGLLVGLNVLGVAAINVCLIHWYGQSIGKRAFKMMMVRADGSRVSVGMVLGMRNLLPILISQLPVIGFLFGLADALFIFRDDRRCIHDHMAGTVVVDVPTEFRGYGRDRAVEVPQRPDAALQ